MHRPISTFEIESLTGGQLTTASDAASSKLTFYHMLSQHDSKQDKTNLKTITKFFNKAMIPFRIVGTLNSEI